MEREGAKVLFQRDRHQNVSVRCGRCAVVVVAAAAAVVVGVALDDPSQRLQNNHIISF